MARGPKRQAPRGPCGFRARSETFCGRGVFSVVGVGAQPGRVAVSPDRATSDRRVLAAVDLLGQPGNSTSSARLCRSPPTVGVPSGAQPGEAHDSRQSGGPGSVGRVPARVRGAGAVVADAAAPLVATAAGDWLVAVRGAVNGDRHTVRVDPRATLLDTLREELEVSGTKTGFDRGQCGACTVHVDGRRVLPCLTPAATANGREGTRIEDLTDGEQLHPMQQAFIDHEDSSVASALPGRSCRPSPWSTRAPRAPTTARRLGAAAHHGEHRRKPAAAYPVRLLPRRHDRLYQREPGSGCSALTGWNSTASGRPDGRLRAHPRPEV